MIFWRPDGKEICYLAADGSLMAVETNTTPAFQIGTPKVMFQPPNPTGGGAYGATGNPVQLRNVSRDGERFVFVVPER